MFKRLFTPERAFRIAMWAVSLAFAAFLLGFGQLVLGDLPLTEQEISVEQFIDPGAQAQIDAERAKVAARSTENQGKSDAAGVALQTIGKDYTSKREAFDNWLATRGVTANASQDPEVIARTQELDGLNDKVRSAERVMDGLNVERVAIGKDLSALEQRQEIIRAAAEALAQHAQSVRDLKVFGLRLAFTLPLLLLACWFILKKRQSAYWPLMRGFALFAFYAFFFELVPYLPSYGGYVRYVVGIVFTIIASHYLIKWMQVYLAKRASDEQKAEVERKQSIKYEDALRKMSANICPGCERPVATTGDVLANYCVHCGMQLFDTCKSCDTRKLAFFRYCMKCGTPAETAPGAPASSAQQAPT
ncbi:zinc ribbon domain-containing protein [Methylovirgula sp. 4M-Z18]|uniref:zinc ribbon domain-containing protein n=1 Tax=Methylovirgula sp. 4M-Z18 TaxID=2293567 RepID=UPI000E2F2570|nr:zinc ribbon domain-containing protein [Methylovirgula sp. 4M-Z18]RFB78640.1 zinc ribbon domain-containing protein [Methylovirgula sp. 4M-Z18]